MNVPGLSRFSREEAEEVKMDEEVFSRIAHALIAHCIDDGDAASKEVSDSLYTIQKRLMKAKYELEKVSKIGVSAKTNKTVTASVQDSLKELNTSVVALQFFDRIAQRMEHALGFLAVLHENEHKINLDDPAEVRRALVRLYNALTMEDERDIFREIEQGNSLKKALKTGNKKLKNMLGNNNGSNIQLF